MANYLSQLRPASFRGVPFLVPSDNASFGRRVITHEYPGRDNPSHEDMGALANEFVIDAIIAGANFIDDAATLQDELNKKGAGTLIHPYYGVLNVIVTQPVRRDHSSDAVGEVRFSITFQKFNEMVYPLALIDTVSGLSKAADSLFGSIESEFNSHFNISGLQDFLVDDAANRVAALSSTVTGLMSKAGLIATARQFVPSSWDVAGNIAEQVLGIFKGISSATKPAHKMVVGSSPSGNTAISARNVLNVMSSVTQISSGDMSGRAVRIGNAQAIDYLFRAGALAAAATTAKYATYESRDDALAVRNSLATNIETLTTDLGNAGYDKSWRDSKTVLAALTRDINERLGRLPKTIKIRPPAPRSSIALANRLYGDDIDNLFANAADIVTRNKVRHPGIVPAQVLEVLING